MLTSQHVTCCLKINDGVSKRQLPVASLQHLVEYVNFKGLLYASSFCHFGLTCWRALPAHRQMKVFPNGPKNVCAATMVLSVLGTEVVNLGIGQLAFVQVRLFVYSDRLQLPLPSLPTVVV